MITTSPRSRLLSPLQTLALGLAALMALYLSIVPVYLIQPNPRAMDAVQQFPSRPVLQYGWPLAAVLLEPTPDSYTAAAGASYEQFSPAAMAVDIAIAGGLMVIAVVAFRGWYRSTTGRLHVSLFDLLLTVSCCAVLLAMILSEYRGHLRDERLWAAIVEEDASNAWGYSSPTTKRVVSPGDFLRLRRILPERWFRPLDRIVGVQLSSNCFPYAVQLDRVIMLDVIDLAPADFAQLKECRRLQTLWVSCIRHTDDSTVADEVAAHLVPLSNLRALNLFLGSVSNQGADSISKLASLEHLNLMAAPIDDTGAEGLARLRRLKSLTLWSGTITDVGLAHIATLPDLEYLAVNHTGITDAGLQSLATLQHLRSLDLSETTITAAGLAHLERLPQLRNLYCQGLQIDDVTPLMRLKNLTELELFATPVSQQQIEQLQQALPNCRILSDFSPSP